MSSSEHLRERRMPGHACVSDTFPAAYAAHCGASRTKHWKVKAEYAETGRSGNKELLQTSKDFAQEALENSWHRSRRREEVSALSFRSSSFSLAHGLDGLYGLHCLARLGASTRSLGSFRDRLWFSGLGTKTARRHGLRPDRC